jgi:hypothetical protein
VSDTSSVHGGNPLSPVGFLFAAASAMDFALSHTQVDDGQSSDEDSDHDGRNHYTGTQVDEGYFTRLAEGEDELNDDPALDEKGDQSAVDPVSSSVDMGGAVVHGGRDLGVAERSDGDPETMDEVGEDIGNDNGSDDDTGTESVGMVDFCIADTQLPAAVQSEALPQQSIEPEESHLTVYDYLSLSAPASTGEVLNPSIAAKISSTPLIFTTTPADVHHTGTYGRSASNNGAFATATTGGASRPAGLSRASGVLLAPPTPQAEEPTQLDGSSLHGSGDTPEKAISGAADGEGQGRGAGGGGAAGGESETHASGPFSAEKALSNSRYLVHARFRTQAQVHASTEKRREAEIGKAPTSTAAPARTDTMSSGFATEWLSAKAPPKGTAKASAYTAPQRAAQPSPVPNSHTQPAHVPATAATVVSGKNTGTTVALPEAVLASAAPSALEERSLEELVLMQQQLQRLIEAKAQQQGQKNHDQQQEQAPITTKEDTVAPLQRQDTSYGMSQPTNQAISGLIKLKAAADTLSPRSDANNNNTTSAAAGAPAPPAAAESTNSRARWYTPGPTVIADPTGNDPGAVAFSSPTVAEPTTGATPSSAAAGKRFFRRKFAGTLAASPATTAAASSTTTSPAAAGAIAAPEQAPSVGGDRAGAADSDVSSPERPQVTHGAKKAVASPRTSPTKVKFNLPTDTAVATNPSGQNSSAAKRPAPAGNGRARVSRVIQDDDVDADDAEAEFDDAQDVSHGTKRANVSAAEGTAGTGGSGTSRNGAGIDTVDSDRYGLPDDLPVSFLRDLPDNFAQLWHTMQALGWHWKIGSGLVSYYYVRPKCAVKKGFLQGRDYFADEEGVWQFVRTVVAQCRSRMPVSAPVRMAAPTAPTIGSATAAGTSAHSIKPFATAAASSGSAVGITGAAGIPAAAAANPSSTLSEHPRALSALPASQSILQLPDDPAMRSIKDIPWKWLWKILKTKGWTWDYGPQHVNFYFAPGYNGKSKDAELNVHKFENEESVRRFIRKQNWPEFSGESLQRNTSMQAESQPPDAYLHDPTWQLASHRGKRPHAAPSKYDASAESGADSGAESENRAGAAAANASTAARSSAGGGAHQQAQRQSKTAKEGGQSKRARVEPSAASATASAVASAAPGGRQTQDRAQAEFLYGQATQQQVWLWCLLCVPGVVERSSIFYDFKDLCSFTTGLLSSPVKYNVNFYVCAGWLSGLPSGPQASPQPHQGSAAPGTARTRGPRTSTAVRARSGVVTGTGVRTTAEPGGGEHLCGQPLRRVGYSRKAQVRGGFVGATYYKLVCCCERYCYVHNFLRPFQCA